MGWLLSAPPVDNDEREMRINLLSDRNPAKKLPDVEYCDDILEAFIMSGKVMSTGMGASPLTWQEITAMNDGANLGLGSWELTQIRRMSEVYCGANSAGSKNPNERAPIITDDKEWLHCQQIEVGALMTARRKARRR